MQNTLWKVIPIRSKGAAYSYAQSTYIHSNNSSMDNSYVFPFDTVGTLTLPTSFTSVDSAVNMYGGIREGGYVYYYKHTSDYSIKRYNETTTEVKTLFIGGVDDLWVASYVNFSVLEDGRIVVALEREAGDYSNWTYEWHIGDFDTGETNMLFSSPINEYDEIYSYADTYNWHFAVCNGKLVPMKWTEYLAADTNYYWMWDFWVIDIETATELYHYNSGAAEQLYYFMQYPVCPPVVVGNNVFFSYHTAYARSPDDEPGVSTAPFIFKVNVSSLSTTLIRPKIDGLIDCGGQLTGACYDPNTGKVIWIVTYINTVDDYYAAVMSLDPSTNSYTSIVSVLAQATATHYPSVTIKSNTNAYVLYADGNIYALNDFVNPIVNTISPITTYYPTDEPQMDHICPVIDGGGYIWYISSGIVYGRKISDNSLVSSDISFPMPAGASPKRTYIYMSRDGKLSVINRNETYTTDTLYILN